MENIDRVNRFFFARILFAPLVLVQYLLRSCSLRKASRRYVTGHEELSEDRRYEQLLSFYRKNLLMRRTVFHFHFERKITNHRHVFVVNDNLGWDSLALLHYLIRYFQIPYPRFLLNNAFIESGNRRQLPLFWDLIDTFYGEGDLERAIGSGRSFFIEKSFVDRHPNVAEKIRDSHISIVPIFCMKDANSVWYVSGEEIKTSAMASFKCDALVEKIEGSFEKLGRRTVKLVEESRRGEKFDLKGLFKLY